MNFLNVGPLELTVILIIAILLVGPKRMVEIARAIGRMTQQLRRYSANFSSALQAEVTATKRAAGESPQDIIRSITEPFTSLQADLQATERETRQAITNMIEGTAKPIQNELDAMESETRQALDNITQYDADDDPAQEN